MSSKSKRFLHLADEFQPPTKKLVSNGDIFIKELSKKQQNKTLDLRQELAYTKEFCKGSDVISLAKYNSGSNTLQEFQDTTTILNHIELMRIAGLAEDEIQLYLDSLKGEDYLLQKHKNYEKSLLMNHLERIKDVLVNHQQSLKEVQSDPIPESSRLDAGLSIKPNSETTKLYKFALENEDLKNKSSAVDPIDCIKNIEQNFLQTLNKQKLPTINKIRRKARKLFNRVNRINNSNYSHSNSQELGQINTDINAYIVESKWDDKTSMPMHIPKQKSFYTCAPKSLPQNYYTIKDGKIIKLGQTECQERDLTCKQKLSIEEIRKLPKFHDYQEGKPCKVLYLRNLSNSIKEIDLRGLFQDYERHNEISYKIMYGKMRGQAFVTFTDEIVASQALNDVNGIFLKNKPVIVQFGHGKC